MIKQLVDILTICELRHDLIEHPVLVANNWRVEAQVKDGGSPDELRRVRLLRANERLHHANDYLIDILGNSVNLCLTLIFRQLLCESRDEF